MLVMALQQQPVSHQVPYYSSQVTSPSAFQDRAPSNMQLLAGYRVAVLTAHHRHVRHLGHLAHLRYLRTLAAQAAAGAAARRSSVTTAAAVTTTGTGTYGHPYFCGDGDGDGYDVPCAAQPAPVQQFTAAAVPQASVQQQQVQVVSAASGSYQQCVITRESGGNPRAVNASSGAGGLYQFLPSTWASLGYSGAPQDASVATQNAAFSKLYATAGTQPWSPSDGC
jgi:hypothetical protein